MDFESRLQAYLEDVPAPSHPYSMCYQTPLTTPRNVPLAEVDLWVALCAQFVDLLSPLIPGRERGPVKIIHRICKHLDGSSDPGSAARLFQVLRAVLRRTVAECPALEDVAALTRELSTKNSLVRSRMEHILKKLLNVAANGGHSCGGPGGPGGPGGRGGPCGSGDPPPAPPTGGVVEWQRKKWSAFFNNRIWFETLDTFGWYVVFPSSLWPPASRQPPHCTAPLSCILQGDGPAQAVPSQGTRPDAPGRAPSALGGHPKGRR